MFVMVFLFCIGGDPALHCIKGWTQPLPMASAETCERLSPRIAWIVAVRDGFLERGYLPYSAQCFEKIEEAPGNES